MATVEVAHTFRNSVEKVAKTIDKYLKEQGKVYGIKVNASKISYIWKLKAKGYSGDVRITDWTDKTTHVEVTVSGIPPIIGASIVRREAQNHFRAISRKIE